MTTGNFFVYATIFTVLLVPLGQRSLEIVGSVCVRWDHLQSRTAMGPHDKYGLSDGTVSSHMERLLAGRLAHNQVDRAAIPVGLHHTLQHGKPRPGTVDGWHEESIYIWRCPPDVR